MKTLQKTRANWFSFVRQKEQIAFRVGLSVIMDQLRVDAKEGIKARSITYSIEPHCTKKTGKVYGVAVRCNNIVMGAGIASSATKLSITELFLRTLSRRATWHVTGSNPRLTKTNELTLWFSSKKRRSRYTSRLYLGVVSTLPLSDLESLEFQGVYSNIVPSPYAVHLLDSNCLGVFNINNLQAVKTIGLSWLNNIP